DVIFIVSTSTEGYAAAGGWDMGLVGGILRLPFDRDSLFRVLDQVKGLVSASSRTAHIAVVIDDSAMARHVLQREMEALNFEVRTAEDGQKGLDLIREVMPDIVLTDIEMPNMTGLELCAAVANEPKISQVPIIVISSITTEAQIRSGFGSGVI
ncbi:MAG: response regulator, partial [Deltaproteobacteria bacterium]|nr:response regulator [Deltaproteobacteria bacterium]